jgi:hypothetical protein
MPWPWRRNERLSVDFLPVVHEPSGAELTAWQPYTARDVVGLVDGLLTGQSRLQADDRNTELIDALLQIRNALTVPVIPGRTT